MEDLVHDFPFSVDLEQRKQVGEPMAGPVVEFQSHRGNRLDDIDAGKLKLVDALLMIFSAAST